MSKKKQEADDHSHCDKCGALRTPLKEHGDGTPVDPSFPQYEGGWVAGGPGDPYGTMVLCPECFKAYRQ